MSDPEQVKRSRRAKRRAEQAAEEGAKGVRPTVADAEPVPASEPGPDNIRDRNKRIREQAAARRRQKRESEKSSTEPRGLGAGEMVDDAFARSTHAATNFVKRYFGVIQWVLVLGAAAGIGWKIYDIRQGRVIAGASDLLMKGIRADLGRLTEDRPPEPKELQELVNPRPTFANDAERIRASAEAYREAISRYPGTGTGLLAKLGLAGVLYDQGKYQEARQTYDDVKASDLAKNDADVRGRSIEGAGLALEAKGDTELALKAFRELENSSIPGFGMLGLYHQARIALLKGERDKAKDLVKRVQEKLAKQPAGEEQQYLAYATSQLLMTLDPAEHAKSQTPYTPEQLDVLKKQIMKDPTKLQKMLEDLGKSVGKGAAPPVPAPPGNAP